MRFRDAGLIDELDLLARMDATRPLDLQPVDLAGLAAAVIEERTGGDRGRTG